MPQPTTSLSKFHYRIIITSPELMSNSTFRERYESALFERKDLLKFNRPGLYPFLTSIVKRSFSDSKLNVYIADYSEFDGSIIIFFALLVEGLLKYNEINEAVENVTKEIRSALSIPGFSAVVEREGTPDPNSNQETQPQTTHRYIKLGVFLVSVICGVFLLLRYMQQEREPKKIEITFVNQSGIPIEVSTPPTKDTLSLAKSPASDTPKVHK